MSIFAKNIQLHELPIISLMGVDTTYWKVDTI